jgi:hypothetical protein
MEINELRIGNYVKFSDPINGTNIYKVYNIDDRGSVSLEDKGQLASCTVKDIEPIELTEEVLEKIVGVKVVDLDYNKTGLIGTNYHFNDCMVSLIYKGDKCHTQLISSRYNISLGIKHLHKLQNAYYLLTGQELNIEL